MRLGVFDSGIGGITVLNELKIRFPEHEFLYFGDTANVPYGTKSENQIQTLVTSAAERMKQKNIDALVIACNTASSIAYAQFKKVLGPIPLIDVVAAGVESILRVLVDPSLPILILGTRATVKSHIYSRLLLEENAKLEIHEQACPLFVPLIEEGWQDHPALLLTVQEYVKKYQNLTPGIALLACTHYPWIKKHIEAELPAWAVIDSAHAVADLITEKLAIESQPRTGATARVRWYFSDPDSVTQKIVNFASTPLESF